MRPKFLSFVFWLMILSGCESTPSSDQRPARPSIFDSSDVRSLRWLDSADPQRDLSDALARGDRRFLGVYGVGPFTPGVDGPVVSRYGVRYLRGTSDTMQGREHFRLNRLASTYAERYNKLLLQRLK